MNKMGINVLLSNFKDIVVTCRKGKEVFCQFTKHRCKTYSYLFSVCLLNIRQFCTSIPLCITI